jgi:hypothetical protein
LLEKWGSVGGGTLMIFSSGEALMESLEVFFYQISSAMVWEDVNLQLLTAILFLIFPML